MESVWSSARENDPKKENFWLSPRSRHPPSLLVSTSVILQPARDASDLHRDVKSSTRHSKQEAVT